jgi:dihydrofolate reductase
MTICMIAAVGKNLELGKDNNLIWHFKDDMAFFKETTTGSSIIMGRKTFESLPKVLPRRKNIIITKKEDYKAEGATVVHSISEALNEVESDTAFIIGGGDIYRQFLPKAQKLYLTEIEAECPDADAYFPAFNKAEYKKELLASYHDKGIHFSHICYTKK